MSRRLKIDAFSLKPSLLPYLLLGTLLSLLLAAQFSVVGGRMHAMGYGGSLLPAAMEWLASVTVFLTYVLLWILTRYTATADAVAASLLFLKRRRIYYSYIGKLTIERSPLDRLMGTNRVTFLSRQGRVLLQWNFVALKGKERGRIRRLSLLLSALPEE